VKAASILLIAAMLIAPFAALASMSTTSASHTATVTADTATVKGGSTNIITITVANSSGSDAIDNVVLYTVPSGWTSFAPLKEIPEDNIVKLASDNIVVLPAGTVLRIWLDNDNIILPENSDILVAKYDNFYFPYDTNNDYRADENIQAEVTSETIITNVFDNENMSVASDDGLTFQLRNDNQVELLADTPVVLVGGNIVKLPDNVLVRTVAPNDNQIAENAELSFADYYQVTLPVSAENVRCLQDTVDYYGGTFTNMNGKLLRLKERIVYIPPSTTVKIQGQPLAYLSEYENENVRLLKDRQLDTTGATVENRPNNWTQDKNNREWVGIGDNNIAAGSSENFPFVITAPSASGDYTFYVRTTDKNGGVKDWSFIVTVDSDLVLTVTADKSWVGGGENVTITVSSENGEPFTFDNIEIWENNAADENKVVWTVDNATPNNDNSVWTVVYTTRENEDWENADGYLTIKVNNATDSVGNTTTKIDNTSVFVDRRAPGAPSLSALNIPTGTENKSSWEISITLKASDDNLIFEPSDYSPENLLLEILVDNQVVQTGTASTTGLVSFTLSLSEGKHTVGARITDKAGNVGEENFDNVIIDTSDPSVSISVKEKSSGNSVSDGGYASENELTISVSFSDSVLGIDNLGNTAPVWGLYDNFKDNENWDRGWIVILTYENGDNVTGIGPVLVPKVYPVLENEDNVVQNVFLSFTFENDTPIELPTGTYVVKAFVGDSMNFNNQKGAHRDNTSITFTIDVSPPDEPDLTTTTYANTTVASPQKSRTSSFYIEGTAEKGATIKIYIVDTSDGSTLSTVTTTASSSTGKWSSTLDLSSYQGKTVKVEVEAVDAAGNASTTRAVYGYFLYDASAPTVTISSQYKTISTDKSSVVISGSVSIDSWETYADISVTVSPSTASVVFDQSTGSFSVSVPLSEGQNLVAVTATDTVGNSGSDSATITRTVAPWATYAIIVVIIALVLAAIAIFRRT